MKLQMKSYLIQLDERTEYQLVAQKTDGTELKSKFYKTENELAELQQRCEDSDDYESTSVMKRIVDVDENENEDDEDSMGGVYNNEVDYTDGADIEDEQDFSEDKSKYKELYTLTNLALRQIPGSPKQRETIKKLNDVRKSLGMKPLKEMDIDINDEVNESVKEDAVSRAKEKADLKKKHDAEKEQEKEEIKSINSEEAEIEESKVFDKLRFKGTDKKLAMSVVDMIKKKAKPKEIAKSFKKLKLPSQELIMKTLGDKSAQDLLQKGQLINQLVGIFDEAEPKGLDGRSKEFRNKVRKLEYNKNKNKSKAYEVWGESTELKEKKLKALQTKSDKTGIPYGILKQVFNRGVAAWRTGHRPGTNPTQWGYARVNSFATKSKGTWGGADKDLADKARGSMKKK
jgi:hypothetical protein